MTYQVLDLLDRVDASCFFPADWMLKGWTAPKQPPCDIKEKEQKGTFKGVANHVNVHQTGILRQVKCVSVVCLFLRCVEAIHAALRINTAKFLCNVTMRPAAQIPTL